MNIPGSWTEYSNGGGGYAVVDAKKIFEAVAYFNHRRDVRVMETCVVDLPSWRDGARVLLRGIQISYIWHDGAAMRLLKTMWRAFVRFLWR